MGKKKPHVSPSKGTPSGIFYLVKECADGGRMIVPLSGMEKIETHCPECGKIIEIPHNALEATLPMISRTDVRITCPECHISRMVIIEEGQPIPPECEDDGIIYINSILFEMLANGEESDSEQIDYFVQTLTGISGDLDSIITVGADIKRLAELKNKVDDKIAEFAEGGEGF